MNFDKNIFTKKRFWAAVLVAQFILFYIFSSSETLVRLFVEFFNKKKNLHQLFFQHSSFSIGDLFYISLIFLFLFIFFTSKKIEKYKILFILVNALYFIYQIFWGMLYFQKPLFEKKQLEKTSQKELERLAIKYIALTNEAREELNQRNTFEISNLNEIKYEILKSQNFIPKEFYTRKITRINNFKPSLFDEILSYTGILGYYNPFTTEAQYNTNLPATYLPFTIAHESAHQLGFARENEANFIGFIICEKSQKLELKYSAYLYTSKSLLYNIRLSNPEFAGQAALFFSEDVKKDIENEKKFFEKHDGFINDIFHFTNDLFLKSNRQEGSITYSYFIELLATYERKKT